MTAQEALAEIKKLVERPMTRSDEWYRTICAVREIVEEHLES